MSFTKIINKTDLKQLTAIFLLIMIALPVFALENVDSVQTFRLTSEDSFVVAGNNRAISSEVSIVETPSDGKVTAPDGNDRFALKTNLLFYAILMPNIEFEWMFANRWSLGVEAQGIWIGKKTPHKVYRIAMITPEVRFWPISRSPLHGMYVGLFGAPGLYDLHNDTDGHEGEGFMSGVSAGYMWPVSKYFSLEAGIGVGYMRVRDKVYTPRDGHFLYQLTKTVNYFGPLRLKLSLVWRF